MLTSHFTQERYNNNCNFSVGGVAFLFVFLLLLLFGLVLLTQLFILRKRKRRESSLRRSKRSCRLSMGMKHLLPGVHLAKSRIQGITEQPIAFYGKRWSTKFWQWLVIISITAIFTESIIDVSSFPFGLFSLWSLNRSVVPFHCFVLIFVIPHFN